MFSCHFYKGEQLLNRLGKVASPECVPIEVNSHAPVTSSGKQFLGLCQNGLKSFDAAF